MFKRFEAAPKAYGTAGVYLLIINLVSRLTTHNIFDTSNFLKYHVWLCIISFFIAASYEKKLKALGKGNGSRSEYFSSFMVTAFISYFYAILTLQNHNAFGIFLGTWTFDNFLEKGWYAIVTIFYFALFLTISFFACNIIAFDFELDFIHELSDSGKRIVKGLPTILVEGLGLFLLNLYAKKHPETGIYNAADIILYIGLLVLLNIIVAFVLEHRLERAGEYVTSDAFMGFFATLILSAITFSSYNVFGIWVSAESANVKAQIFQAVILVIIIYLSSTTCHASFEVRDDKFGT